MSVPADILRRQDERESSARTHARSSARMIVPVRGAGALRAAESRLLAPVPA
jgi:hypothetical protein